MDFRILCICGLLFVCGVMLGGCSNNSPSGATPSTGGRGNAAPSPVSSATVQPAVAVKPPFERPVLETKRGSYFSYSVPAGWKVSETANGVDMTSPDGKLIASSALLTGTPGSNTPWGFVQQVLTAIGASSVKMIHSKDLPPVKSGYPGINWTIQEIEATCVNK